MSESLEFMLLEGACPSCESELDITAVSGTEQFLDEHTPWDWGEKEVTVWADPQYASDDGCWELTCTSCAKQFAVHHHSNGDWSGSESWPTPA